MKKLINLLPPEELKQRRLNEVGEEIRIFGFGIILTLALTAAVVAAGQFVLLDRHQAVTEILVTRQAELADLQKTKYRQQIDLLNASLANFAALEKLPDEWSNILQEFAKLVPQDLALDTFQVDLQTGKIEAAGRASSRASVLALRQNILASNYFGNVNFPLSNLEKDRDTAWKYRFYLKAGRK